MVQSNIGMVGRGELKYSPLSSRVAYSHYSPCPQVDTWYHTGESANAPEKMHSVWMDRRVGVVLVGK